MPPPPKRRLPVILVLLCLIPQLFSNCYTGYRKKDGEYEFVYSAIPFTKGDYEWVLSPSPRKFKIIQNGHFGYAHDDVRVYFRAKPIPLAEIESFQVINEDYSKDRAHVFLGEKLMIEADPESFQIIDHYYTRDKNHVFSGRHIIPNADPLTFRSDKNGGGRDRNGCYLYGSPCPCKAGK